MMQVGFTGIVRVALLILGGFLTSTAFGHKASDSYLNLRIEEGKVTGQWDLALRDLEYAIGIDANEDGAITWGEVQQRHREIEQYALNHLRIQIDGSVTAWRVTHHALEAHTDGTYAAVFFEVPHRAEVRELSLRYSAFFADDPQHRGLARFEMSGEKVSMLTAVLSPDKPEAQFIVGAARSQAARARVFASTGVWHIWHGADHLLFLFALLLPAVLYRRDHDWRGVARLRPALIEVARVVTAFTVAHSLTLTVATMDWLRPPSRLIETIIALSIILAALNNVRPYFRGRAWVVAFFFGLIHGFGFAEVLVDLGLTKWDLAVALVGFNLGVEAGQLLVVAIFLPVAFLTRNSWFYRSVALKGGSILVSILAGIWVIERAFDFKVLPF